MKKLLFIDACIRDEESRTKKIVTPIIEDLKSKYEIETLVINKLNLNIVKKEELNERMKGNIPDEVLSWAYSVRNADRIVIAAPFWDMSIPAALKNFFELVSINNITFTNGETRCYGNCKCEKMLFITTRGMDINTGDRLDQATSYLEALNWLWGIKELKVIASTNMDYVSFDEIQAKINKAIEEGLNYCKSF